jgi:DNA-binding IclR family transcriptional regulator
MENTPVKVVKKALDALEYVVEESAGKPGVTLSEIAEHIGERVTTVRNILKTLEMCGYLSRPAGRLYSPGPKCADLARVSMGKDLVTNAEEALNTLAKITGESIVLATLAGSTRRVLMRVEGGQLIRINSQVAEDGAFWSLVTNRVMAAFISAEEVDLVIKENGLPGETWPGAERRSSLEASLEDIKNQGVAEIFIENEYYAIAIPLLQRNGVLLGSIGLYMPAFRYTSVRRIELITALRQAADDITNRM